jgi:hypothetical protein
MVASLFGQTREILSIKLHPLQSFLTNKELYDVLERVMITVVNQVICLNVYLGPVSMPWFEEGRCCFLM